MKGTSGGSGDGREALELFWFAVAAMKGSLHERKGPNATFSTQTFSRALCISRKLASDNAAFAKKIHFLENY